MIIDRIENRDLYAGLCPVFKTAMDFMAGLRSAPDGHYDHPTDPRIFANSMALETSPGEGRLLEFHRRYADVHFVLEGREVIEWETLDHLTPAVDYDPDKDIGFMDGPATAVVLEPGMFCVTLPTDGHKPGGCVGAPAHLRKIVLKIPVD